MWFGGFGWNYVGKWLSLMMLPWVACRLRAAGD